MTHSLGDPPRRRDLTDGMLAVVGAGGSSRVASSIPRRITRAQL